jgi:dolichol-phosphate mannosyltransferase
MTFNLVGVTGVAVQFVALAWLLGSGVHYLGATVLAVEAAVLNNFFWHERWTWVDRRMDGPSGTMARLVRFNTTVGLLSIAENVVFMKLLVGTLALNYLLGNLVSIVACSVANYVLSDLFVFRRIDPAQLNFDGNRSFRGPHDERTT